MTELELRECREPHAMLWSLQNAGKLSERKARLFAAACCRRIWPLIADVRSRHAVELAERSADESVSMKELQAASSEAETSFKTAFADGRGADDDDPTHWAVCAAFYASHPQLDALHLALVLDGTGRASAGRVHQEMAAQADLLRDLLGPLPFRPVILPPSVRTWNVGTAARLAQAAYDNRQLPAGTLGQERLMVLADALEDAGCRDQEVLAHLREQGRIHVRGCWTVDLLLEQS